MKLAKPAFDLGLSTNRLEPMLDFWQTAIGAPFEALLKIRPGLEQHRHDLAGSVLKINHRIDPLPPSPPSGYLELLIARPAVGEPQSLSDPDGNRVQLVALGHRGVIQIGVQVAVRDLQAQRRFYKDALGLREVSQSAGGDFSGRIQPYSYRTRRRRSARRPVRWWRLALSDLASLLSR